MQLVQIKLKQAISPSVGRIQLSESNDIVSYFIWSLRKITNLYLETRQDL